MRHLFSLLKFVLLPLLIITTIIGKFQVGSAAITGLGLVPGTCGTSLVVTAAGGVVALNGLDNVQAGLRQAWTGKSAQTLTSSAVESATGSYIAGEIVDAGIGMISPGGVLKFAQWFKKTCFTAGTQIVVGTEYNGEGSGVEYVTVNIEDIKVGDLVYSYDTITEEVSQKSVTDTFVRTSNHINYLTIIDENGHEQVIETTDSHPFLVVTDNPDLSRVAQEVVDENGATLHHENIGVTENGYWIEAKDLRVGDVFLGANGELSTLVDKERVEFPNGITVYNFTVDGNHDYFVIAQEYEYGQTCVLVHNANYTNIKVTSNIKASPKLVREAEKAGSSPQIQKDIDHLVHQLQKGNISPGIHNRHLFSGIFEARARNGGRVYFRNTQNGLEILGKSSKDNQNIVIEILRNLYGT